MKDSFKRDQAHLLDEDLVLLANGELTTHRSAAVGLHLETCNRCQNRFHEIQRTLENYIEARRTELDPQVPPIQSSRAKLQCRLAGARARPRSWLDQLTPRPARVLWALGLATLAIAALIPRLGRIVLTPDAERMGRRFAPDPRLTPGLATLAPRTELCASQSNEPSASVDRELGIEVFRIHGILDPLSRAYEIDYLIPPELGGVRDIRNLWPQPYGGYPWNAYVKDALEDHLLSAVCGGRVGLATAQRDLATDWIAAYRKHFRTREPLLQHATFLKDEPWE